MYETQKLKAGSVRSDLEIELHMLDLVERGGTISQRSVATELGIALGLVNAYFKRAIGKGLVKISQIPPNRYAYYLTPQGFNEKRRLTTEYMFQSFNFFRMARQQCDGLIAHAAEQGWLRLACAGTGEIGEVALLSSLVFEAKIVGFIDPHYGHARFSNLPVFTGMDEIGPVDAIILSDFQHPQETYAALRGKFPDSRILIPELLKVSRVLPARDPS